jgi:hypothetical protein
MVSDVLADAVRQIDRYLATMLHVYQGVEGPLGKLTTLMNAARLCLDTPPGLAQRQMEAIWKALADLDVQPVRRAVRAAKRTLKCGR